MIRALSSVLLLSFGLLGCSTETQRDSAAATPSASALAAIPERAITAPKKFGAAISATEPVVALSDVLEQPERFRDQAITVEGEVRSACTRRGCWMEVAPRADPKLAGCRVTFKDYGFFVPTDSAGAHAKVHGTLGVNLLPAERVAHLESEGAQFRNKRADGRADELRLVATGVELWR